MSKVDKFVRKNYFKLVIGGEGATGKSTFCKRLTGKLKADDILEMTPGVDFHSLKIKNNVINLQIWDLGGQDQFRYFQDDFFEGASVIILLYAVDSYITFKNIENWLKLLPKEMTDQIFLVGNKIDLTNRSVSIEEALKFAESRGMKYYEISAVNGVGFDDFQHDLIKTIEKIYFKRKKVNN